MPTLDTISNHKKRGLNQPNHENENSKKVQRMTMRRRMLEDEDTVSQNNTVTTNNNYPPTTTPNENNICFNNKSNENEKGVLNLNSVNDKTTTNTTTTNDLDLDLSDPYFLTSLNYNNNASNRYCCVGFPCLHFSKLNLKNSSTNDNSNESESDKMKKKNQIVLLSSYPRRGRNFGDPRLDRGYSSALNRSDVDADKSNYSNSTATTLLLPYQELIQQYNDFCDLYHCPPNAGILVAIRFRLPTLRVSSGDSFHDADVLALVELLLHNDNCNYSLSYVRRLDISVANAKRYGRRLKGFGSHGAFALSKVIQKSKYLEELFISRNRIGPYGAASIFLAASNNSKLRTLVMRKCQISSQGALAFTQHILHSKVQGREDATCALQEIDLSCNYLGHIGIKVIQESLIRYNNQSEVNKIEIDLDGNLVLQEILNGLTHGLGLLLVAFGKSIQCKYIYDGR